MSGREPVEGRAPCPICGRRSAYIRSEDRFFHLDGSENDWCWAQIHQPYPPIDDVTIEPVR